MEGSRRLAKLWTKRVGLPKAALPFEFMIEALPKVCRKFAESLPKLLALIKIIS